MMHRRMLAVSAILLIMGAVPSGARTIPADPPAPDGLTAFNGLVVDDAVIDRARAMTVERPGAESGVFELPAPAVKVNALSKSDIDAIQSLVHDLDQPGSGAISRFMPVSPAVVSAITQDARGHDADVYRQDCTAFAAPALLGRDEISGLIRVGVRLNVVGFRSFVSVGNTVQVPVIHTLEFASDAITDGARRQAFLVAVDTAKVLSPGDTLVGKTRGKRLWVLVVPQHYRDAAL